MKSFCATFQSSYRGLKGQSFSTKGPKKLDNRCHVVKRQASISCVRLIDTRVGGD